MPKAKRKSNVSEVALPSMAGQDRGESRPRIHVPIDEQTAKAIRLGAPVSILIKGQVRSIDDYSGFGTEQYSVCVETQQLEVSSTNEFSELIEDEFVL